MSSGRVIEQSSGFSVCSCSWEWCLIKETHQAGTGTSCLTFPSFSYSWGWCLIGENHQTVTQTSCPTFLKSGVSLRKHIRQLLRQVVWLPLYTYVGKGGVSSMRLIWQSPRQVIELPSRVVSCQGDSFSSYPEKFSDFSQESHHRDLLGIYLNTLLLHVWSCPYRKK